MKHTLFVLAVWLMSAPDSYSQTNKMDDYLVKDATVVSAHKSSTSLPPKSQGYMINDDPASISKPTVPQKLQSIIGHTQNLKNTTQVLKANTEAIEANTKALMANTEALQANIKAAQANKHIRAEQRQQATPVPPAPAKLPVYTPPVLAKKTPVATPAPVTPQPAPVSKEMLKPAVPVVAVAKVPMKTIEIPAEKPKTVSTPVAAAPVKAEMSSAMPEGRTISTMSMAAGNIKVVPTVANKDLPNPAAAKSTKPVEVKSNAMTAMSMVAATAPSAKPAAAVTMPLPKPLAAPAATPAPAAAATASAKAPAAVKMEEIVRNSKNANMADLMQLPLLEKMYDYKISNPKYYPAAAKTGLKHSDVITTSGYLQVVATDDSGKATESYSLQLTLNTAKGDSCFIVKIPAEQLAMLGGKEATENSKKFVRELVKGRVPCTGGNIIRKPVYVTVTGQLSYNSSHATFMRNSKVACQGRRDMNSYTPWEIIASNVTFATPQ